MMTWDDAMRWDEATLDAMRAGQIRESLSLEYKAAGALTSKNITGQAEKVRLDISKDVSAIANSAGGVIVTAALYIVGVWEAGNAFQFCCLAMAGIRHRIR